MTPIRSAKKTAAALGYYVREGSYTGTTDDRLGRWYFGHADGGFRPWGIGYRTQREAWEAAAYEHARIEFAAKSHAFALICNAYRAKKIGDAEFLAARKAFDEAIAIVNAAMDAVVEDDVTEAADDRQFSLL